MGSTPRLSQQIFCRPDKLICSHSIYLVVLFFVASTLLILLQNDGYPTFSFDKGLRFGANQDHNARSQLISVESPLIKSNRTISVSYGPFNISEQSMMPEVTLYPLEKPCDNCTTTAMRALLLNSSSREPLLPDSGIHLHHIIFFNSGVKDLVCPQYGERFFGGGNEGWTRRWNSHGDYGYFSDGSDEWYAVVEIMNDSPWAGQVEVEVIFEVEMEKPMKRVRPVWLDATGCGRAEVEVKSTTEPFTYETPTWTSTIDGLLLDVAAHQHDGGIEMTGELNGETLCRSVQLYGTQTTEAHITAAGVCKPMRMIRKGDRLRAEAFYDPLQRPLAMHNGEPDPVMGSMGVYIGVD